MIKEIINWISKLKIEEAVNFIDQIIEIHQEEIKAEASGKLMIDNGLIEIEDIEGEIIIIGDVHGNLETLLKILTVENVTEKLKEKRLYIVFLGDYIDRGLKSFETLMLALKLKENYPSQIILLRGNHEGPNDLVAYPHTFPYELQLRFKDNASLVYLKTRQLFNAMPHIAKTRNGMVMLHGGVPTEANNIREVALARELHPTKPHLTEILWNDPDETGIRGAHPSPRGVGKIFGVDYTIKFLKIMNAKVIVRGHEATLNGYKISHRRRIITIFSRIGPPYWNRNAAYIHFNLHEKPESIIEAIKLIS